VDFSTATVLIRVAKKDLFAQKKTGRLRAASLIVSQLLSS
jgi:hypothetical protein